MELFEKRRGWPQVGDTIKIVRHMGTLDRYFSIGDKGVIKTVGAASAYIDFRNMGNKEIVQGGEWFVKHGEYEVLK